MSREERAMSERRPPGDGRPHIVLLVNPDPPTDGADDEWYEEVCVSELPPNEWQRQLAAMVEDARQLDEELDAMRQADEDERDRERREWSGESPLSRD
jgi:hypothetical protein